MMLRLLLGALLAAPLLSQGQDNKITGHVVDAKTKEPVPFASIGLRNDGTGALTNEFGVFQLPGFEKGPTDSLIVMTLGYDRNTKFVKKGSSTDLTIELKKRVIELQGVTVKGGKVKNLALGTRADRPDEGILQGQAGSQYAFLIKNDKQKKLGNVRSVSFYIGENGFPREPFRVRLYKADGNYNAPNTDLLTENVVVSAPQGGQWYTIDLTQYNVPAPEEGFYVAMEWIVGGDKFYTANFMDNYTAYGQVMSPTFEFKESRTWSYSIAKGWNQLTLANGQGKRWNAMIRAEVDMIKD
ncbi:carboxypeptidase-like regulatory domain-containing protein [uncultured Hymenobacter sp.]|uniref:carboxypeptidase-like regulatory domain-containing protein n=1 Tax=uncultured Hymenobacter sp. TaxID=170016 RepID=UPI0035CA010E